MKKLTVLFVAFLLCSQTFMANENHPEKVLRKKLHNEIVKLLDSKDFQFKEALAKAEITILINKKNELIVVDVNSENDDLKWYVKRKINYKKTSVNTLNRLKVYKIPLKIVKNS